MATPADSFLADLNELSDNEADFVVEEGADAENIKEDIDGELADMESLNHDDLDTVLKLQKSQRYADIIQKVEDALQKGYEIPEHGIVSEDDPEYQLIVDSNALSVDIENELVIIHNFTRDNNHPKLFPALNSPVHPPIDFAPAVEAYNHAIALDSARKKVVDFVESRMVYIAPNLSAIVGSAVAAKLMGTAGSLAALAKMPACNVQLLGARRKNLAGFSTATSQYRVGYIEQTEIFQSTPPSLRMLASCVLAAKLTLAARVDCSRRDLTGKIGRTLREEICKKIENWPEPSPPNIPKLIPVC